MNVLLVGMALSIGAPALKPPKNAASPIEGTWELVQWLQSGLAMAISEGTLMELRPNGKRLWRNGRDEEFEERGYKLIDKSKPPAIDLIKPSGAKEPVLHRAIFKIEGDTLTICVGPTDGERPTTFEAGAQTGRMLMTYKRAKK